METYETQCEKRAFIVYDALHMKRALMQFADNKGPDQPAHLRVFVVYLQNKWILMCTTKAYSLTQSHYLHKL